ncbi:class I SAM-dependent RNA methyltransferase [Geopsychrobacter electrodiphilus]|uniref:class I SAM-dependent RNA methyltransferase n=1 Tax=Geopsychrobacter electrodiphilus TaxID=225196 RepID=UPI00035E7C32|nr:TRAM domain-containing protein [Geopsychrobacter electrodiphilus]
MPEGLIGPLEIHSLAFGGNGVARYDGRVIFVRGAVPGDLVRVRVLREKKRYAEAEAVHFDRLSPTRCEPGCPVFGECGGCQWQMLPYAAQLEYKTRIFRDILRRQAGVAEELILPILESPAIWNYRCRMQFKCELRSDARLAIGFFRPGSHQVVDTDSCPVAAPLFNRLLPVVRSLLQQTPFAAHISQLDMESGDAEDVRLVLHYAGSDLKGLSRCLQPLLSNQSLSLYVQQGRKSALQYLGGPRELTFSVDSPALELSYGAGGFSQINLEQNRRMVAEALRMVDVQPDWRVLDLYCGMGNFSLPFASRVAQVVAVEEFAGSVKQGAVNARRNRIENIEFVARSAAGAYVAFSAAAGFDLVILDPPRSGAREVVTDLVAQKAPRILYVSCDPMTLVRDLNELQRGGYHLVASRPVDMFPHTWHLESLTMLVRD